MKYVVVLCDGMADYPVPALGGKTPMMVAKKPHIDALAAKAEVGLVRTVAPGLKPGSDVANMSVLGFDPHRFYTGRSPLEAASIGIDMKDSDVSLRTNLVTLSDKGEPFADKVIEDYCADDISTEEARQLIEAVQAAFGGGEYDFYTGVSYRHCLIWHGGTTELGNMTPPHDITGKVMVSAVDLLKGIANCAGMEVAEVPGATGYIDTDFEGKAKAALDLLTRNDLVYVHFEAPDECGHRNEPENKVKAIEMIDSRVLPILEEGLEQYEDYKILLLPDHPTPIVTRTHASDPVPYLLYQKSAPKTGVDTINEETAKATGIYMENGPAMMPHFLGQDA